MIPHHEKSRRSSNSSLIAHSTPSINFDTNTTSRLTVFAFLSAIFLLLLLHQTYHHKHPTFSSSSSSSSSSSFSSSSIPHHEDGQANRTPDHVTDSDPNADEIRAFHPYGSAAALFVLYGAYRGGNNTFAVTGLGSKPLFVYGKPEFECYWEAAPRLPSWSSSMSSRSGGPQSSPSSSSNSGRPQVKSRITHSMLPDWGFGRVYTVVVVNCTFDEPVGTDSQGGQLVLYASYGDGLGKPLERIVALEEEKGTYNASLYEAPYPYEFLYCGSPLFSDVNAERVREWIAYHVMLFGPKSHFIFHDAGGMHAEVRAVLEPWKKLGFITIQDVKETSRYDGYYYNQFLILNDCLHRTKFMANWTFFFDVDEYIFISPELTFRTIMDLHVNHTMLRFKQLRMSDALCQYPEPDNDTRLAFAKLVYGEEFRDMKYAVQARQVYATGVHYSQKELGHMEGEIGWAWWPHMHFYHYHNSISKHGKLCQNITNNATSFMYDGRVYNLDTSMVSLGLAVKEFEHQHIRRTQNPSES